MKNRIPDYLQAPKQVGQSTLPDIHALRNLAQNQIACRVRQAEMFVQAHPGKGIGAAFCIGIFLGWMIKRR
jgi:ElaB/YqjD/DUF883 family membrane-anchored ribosome-binding protein